MKLPCGRTPKDSYLCCNRKHYWWNTYWMRTPIGWELRCLFCYHTIVIWDKEMDIVNYIFKNKTLNWED